MLLEIEKKFLEVTIIYTLSPIASPFLFCACCHLLCMRDALNNLLSLSDKCNAGKRLDNFAKV